MSNFFGQLVVEKFGHVASLLGSLFISFVPIVLFMAMPETLGHRGCHVKVKKEIESLDASYKSMAS